MLTSTSILTGFRFKHKLKRMPINTSQIQFKMLEVHIDITIVTKIMPMNSIITRLTLLKEKLDLSKVLILTTTLSQTQVVDMSRHQKSLNKKLHN
jgi:hypothetical protein